MMDKLEDYEHYKLLSELVERYIKVIDPNGNVDSDIIYSNVIHKNWSKLNDGSIANIEGYLFMAVKNAIINETNRKKRLDQLDNEVTDLSYEQDFDKRESEKLYNSMYRLIDLMIANDTTMIRPEQNKPYLKKVCYDVIDNMLDFRSQKYRLRDNKKMIELYYKIFQAIHDLLKT